jgi:hypothetical protein
MPGAIEPAPTAEPGKIIGDAAAVLRKGAAKRGRGKSQQVVSGGGGLPRHQVKAIERNEAAKRVHGKEFMDWAQNHLNTAQMNGVMPTSITHRHGDYEISLNYGAHPGGTPARPEVAQEKPLALEAGSGLQSPQPDNPGLWNHGEEPMPPTRVMPKVQDSNATQPLKLPSQAMREAMARTTFSPHPVAEVAPPQATNLTTRTGAPVAQPGATPVNRAPKRIPTIIKSLNQSTDETKVRAGNTFDAIAARRQQDGTAGFKAL